ncbi:hypothetical protein THAOC_13537 [Thalassiosira oceanica]|uniref:Uncharacterized protein n=1 Tax=Thalassiosira oceanica TaxID=159749 RepID=K0SX76_THAOC|nr:hypothetical protein THAOC_13537 [Thalassiosira oceanica]|eukprot:EJK65586.1 hypothetical protein THAOC_13537 [Thalassiosira oceanica]
MTHTSVVEARRRKRTACTHFNNFTVHAIARAAHVSSLRFSLRDGRVVLGVLMASNVTASNSGEPNRVPICPFSDFFIGLFYRKNEERRGQPDKFFLHHDTDLPDDLERGGCRSPGGVTAAGAKTDEQKAFTVSRRRRRPRMAAETGIEARRSEDRGDTRLVLRSARVRGDGACVRIHRDAGLLRLHRDLSN